MTTGEAAQVLGVSAETVRRWIRRGELRGHVEERHVRARYFADPRAVAELRDARRQVTDVMATADGERLLRGSSADAAADGAVRALAAERDRYRAENVALREVVVRLNAAMDHMRAASEEQALAVAEQQAALVQLLTPHSPAG